MSTHRWLTVRISAAVLLGMAGACFVHLGDCTSHGVSINPCVSSASLGSTLRLSADVDGSPGAPIKWILPDSAQTGFAINLNGNTLELIGSSALGGTYRLRAESAGDSSRYAEAFVNMATQNFGYPPSPLQINGTDAPTNYQAAVASGGGYYYVAYADVPDPLAGEGAPTTLPPGDTTNYFVRQFRASTNTATGVVIPNQFSQFDGTTTQGFNSTAPNISADCNGNAYWIDWPDSKTMVLRQLTAAGVLSPDQSLSGFYPGVTPVVACDGSIYFFGYDFFRNSGLYRISSFGEAPELMDVPELPDLVYQFKSLAVDTEGRLLLGAHGFAFPAPPHSIVRLIVDGNSATVDEGFPCDLVPSSGYDEVDVDQLAVDGSGVIYAGTSDLLGLSTPGGSNPTRVIRGINGLGTQLFTIDSYVYTCTNGCTVGCGDTVPFTKITSLSAGNDGTLRIFDDVTLGGTESDPCQMTVRLVLLHP